ncbi:MAG: hypothetical protein WEB88_04915 [Gemmatimonadota bacterium]
MRRSSRRTWRPLLATVMLAAGVSCATDEDPFGPSDGLRLLVESDPPGARILVDGRESGRFTPDTVFGLGSRHQVQARLDTLGLTYRYLANVAIPNEEEVPVLMGPLVLRCGDPACYAGRHRYHTAAGMRFATNPVGAHFLHDATENGLFYPAGSTNSYTSSGMPVFAAVMSGDTVALGVYDQPVLAGRPTSTVVEGEGRVYVDQTSWVVPLPRFVSRTPSPARGVAIRQQIVAEDATEGVVVIRLTYHNITNRESYQRMDPGVPRTGVTLHQVFLGYVLDADIGNPDDDVLTYDPELQSTILYDGNFFESNFSGGWNRHPALVGLRLLEAPVGARVVLNGYPRVAEDWGAGRSNERVGWYMLSGNRPFAPDHPDLGIGFLPSVPSDMRITVSAGPFTMRPGDSLSITVAVALAEPVPDTFTSGEGYLEPGEPHDRTRPIYAVAAGLRERLRAAENVSFEPPLPPEPPDSTGG